MQLSAPETVTNVPSLPHEPVITDKDTGNGVGGTTPEGKKLLLKYRKSRCRKNILQTLKVWGGTGVCEPNNLITYIDFEIEKYLKNSKTK